MKMIQAAFGLPMHGKGMSGKLLAYAAQRFRRTGNFAASSQYFVAVDCFLTFANHHWPRVTTHRLQKGSFIAGAAIGTVRALFFAAGRLAHGWDKRLSGIRVKGPVECIE
jgi:hypothetical protein